MKRGLVSFMRIMGPDLLRLGRWMWEQFDGDPEQARSFISLIHNHGLRLDEERARVDAELNKP